MASRFAGASVLVGAGLAFGVSVTSPLLAQEDPDDAVLRATVDYVGADGFYLPLGADDGLVEGDTVAISAEASGETIGLLLMTSVTRRRSVAVGLSGPALERGQTVYVHLARRERTEVGRPEGELPGRIESNAPDEARPREVSGPTTPRSGRRAAPSSGRGLRVSGRVAFDLEARETHTRWTGELFGDTRRRFATPTTRLTMSVQGLPGGVELRTSLRGSYRWNEGATGPPPLSVRAYEAALQKRFEALPIEVLLGRFSNPYEAYSSYWDGMLVRVGGRRGPSVGVVAGFEPRRYDEGFRAGLGKTTAFTDFGAGGRAWRYDTDVSVHLLWPEGAAHSSFVGWSQRLRVGRVSLHQRLRIDGGLDGRDWSLTDLRLRARVPPAATLAIRGAYGRMRPAMWLAPELGGLAPELGGEVALPDLLASRREELSMGLELDARSAHLSVDAGRTRRSTGEDGASFSGRAMVELGSTRLLLSGRLWSYGASRSYAAAPSLSFDAGSMRWRTAYRFYASRASHGAFDTHALELGTSTTVSDEIRLTASGEWQWGANLGGARIRLGVWKSF